MQLDTTIGWQTVFADLSIILFMMTASAVGNAPTASKNQTMVPPVAAETVPVAVWRDAPGAQPLHDWLASQGQDPRVRFSFIVRYRDGGSPKAAAQLLALAQSTGHNSRIMLEPTGFDETLVIARFEGPPPTDVQTQMLPKPGQPKEKR